MPGILIDSPMDDVLSGQLDISLPSDPLPFAPCDVPCVSFSGFLRKSGHSSRTGVALASWSGGRRWDLRCDVVPSGRSAPGNSPVTSGH